jgi:hypothetical protein
VSFPEQVHDGWIIRRVSDGKLYPTCFSPKRAEVERVMKAGDGHGASTQEVVPCTLTITWRDATEE